MNQTSSDFAQEGPFDFKPTAEQGKIFEDNPIQDYKNSQQNTTTEEAYEGGPHFLREKRGVPQNILQKIETAHNNGWGAVLGNFSASQKNLAFVILMVLAAGIVAALVSMALTESRVQEKETPQTVEKTLEENAASTLTPTSAASSAQGLTQVAQLGEGVTHLARRALSQYLQESGKNLNAEQRIYAEDFLKDATGSFLLTVGQKLNFSSTDIENAYTQSTQLSDAQLANLTQFVMRVNF